MTAQATQPADKGQTTDATAQTTATQQQQTVPEKPEPAPVNQPPEIQKPATSVPEETLFETPEDKNRQTEVLPEGGDKPQPDGEPYDFKLPEGFDVDPDGLKEAEAISRELGVKPAQAQKFIDLYAKTVAKQHNAHHAQLTEQDRQWMREIKADPELGGANLARTRERINIAVRRFGSPDLVAGLGKSPMANWPPLVRLLHNVGAYGEEAASDGNRAPAEKRELSAGEVLFPNMTKG